MPTNREILFILKMQNQAGSAARSFANEIKNAATSTQQSLRNINTLGASTVRVMQTVTQSAGRVVNAMNAVSASAKAAQSAVNSMGAGSVRTMQTVTQSTGRAVGGLKAITTAANQAKAAVAGVGAVKPPIPPSQARPPSTVTPRAGRPTLTPGGYGFSLGGITHEFSALESLTHHVTGVFGQLVQAGGSLIGIMVGLEGFKRFGEFEQSIATIKGLRGINPGEEKTLRSTAQNLGSGEIGSFGPVDVAKGMEVLARAGQGVPDIINNITAAMHLAAATGRDLDSSTNDLTRILSEFGIGSNRAGDAVDVLSKTTSIAHIRFEDLALAMRYVGPVAKALGQSFNDVNAALGVLADNGRVGSRGGGADLREIFTKLENPTKTARDAVKSMGLTMKDLSPQTQSVVSIFEKLNAKGLDASRAARIFGSEHAAAGVILASNVDKLKEYGAATCNAAGFSAKLAEIESDTPLRALDRIKNAAENVAHDIGNANHLAITGALDVVAQMINQLRGLPAGFDQIGQAAQTATLAVKLLGGAVAAFVALTAIESVLAAPYLSLGIAIAGAATYVYSLRNEMVTFNGVTVQLGSLGEAAWDLITTSMSNAWATLKNFSASVVQFGSDLYTSVVDTASKIGSSFEGAWEKIQDGARLALANVEDAWANLKVSFATIGSDAGTALLNGLKAGVNLAANLVNDLLGKINAVGGKIGLSVPQLPTLNYGGSTDPAAPQAKAITAAVDAVRKEFAERGANRAADAARQDAPLGGALVSAGSAWDKTTTAFGKRMDELSDIVSKNAVKIQSAKDAARLEQERGTARGLAAGYTGNSAFAGGKPTGLPQLDPDAPGGRGGGRARAARLSPEEKADKTGTDYVTKQIDALQKQAALADLVGKARDRANAVEQVSNQLAETDNLSAAKRNQLLSEFTSKYDQVQAAIQAKRTVFAGVNSGLQSYAEQAGNYFKNAQTLAGDTFANIEDSLSSFVSTGKLGVRDLVTTFLSEFVRLEAIRPLLVSLDKAIQGSMTGSNVLLPIGGLLTGSSPSLNTAIVTAHHAGGLVGRGGATGFTKTVDASAWRGAPRFHTGGINAIGSDERAIIAKKDEAVFPTVRLPNGQFGIKGTGGSGGARNFAPTTNISINMQGSSGNAAQDKAHADYVSKQMRAELDAYMAQYIQDQQRPGGTLKRKYIFRAVIPNYLFARLPYTCCNVSTCDMVLSRFGDDAVNSSVVMSIRVTPEMIHAIDHCVFQRRKASKQGKAISRAMIVNEILTNSPVLLEARSYNTKVIAEGNRK